MWSGAKDKRLTSSSAEDLDGGVCNTIESHTDPGPTYFHDPYVGTVFDDSENLSTAAMAAATATVSQ